MSALTATDPKGAGLSPDGLARIVPWMDRLVADGRLAGLSVTVARRGRVASPAPAAKRI